MARHFRYLATVIMVCLFVPIATVLFAASGLYYRHSRYFWDPIDDHKFSVSGKSAEVLFIGDSSLVHGLMTRRIHEETGLSAYNLGVPGPAFIMDYDLLVERYLQNNKRPRLVVLYMAPTTRITPPYAFRPAWYEGATMLVRYGTVRDIVRFFAAHPEEFDSFVLLVWEHALHPDLSGKGYLVSTSALEKGDGYIPIEGLKAMLSADKCPISSSPVAPDEEFIRRFRREFAERGIPTAVYLAPVPDCEPTFQSISGKYSGLVDNVPYMLPHQWFADDLQREHLGADGAEENSRIVAQFVRQWSAHTAMAAQIP